MVWFRASLRYAGALVVGRANLLAVGWAALRTNLPAMSGFALAAGCVRAIRRGLRAGVAVAVAVSSEGRAFVAVGRLSPQRG